MSTYTVNSGVGSHFMLFVVIVTVRPSYFNSCLPTLDLPKWVTVMTYIFLFWNFVCKICNTQNQISLKRTAVLPNAMPILLLFGTQWGQNLIKVAFECLSIFMRYIDSKLSIFTRFENISWNYRGKNGDWSANSKWI